MIVQAFFPLTVRVSFFDFFGLNGGLFMKKRREAVNLTNCAIMRSLLVVGGKWKMLLLFLMARESANGYLRYGDFLNLVPKLSPRVLTQQLRDLEEDGLVSRHVFQVIPPRVEYSLTDMGKQMIPVLDALHQFGNNYKKEILEKEAAEQAEAAQAAAGVLSDDSTPETAESAVPADEALNAPE